MMFEEQRKFRRISAWEHYEVGDLSGNQIMSSFFCHNGKFILYSQSNRTLMKIFKESNECKHLNNMLAPGQRTDYSKARVLAETLG